MTLFGLMSTGLAIADVKVVNTTNFPVRVVMFIEAATEAYVRSSDIPSEKCQWLQGDVAANKWRYIVQVKEKRTWETIWDTIWTTGSGNWDSKSNRELLILQYGNENPTYTVTDNYIGFGSGTENFVKDKKPIRIECIGAANRVRWGAKHDWTPEQAWDNAYGRE